VFVAIAEAAKMATPLAMRAIVAKASCSKLGSRGAKAQRLHPSSCAH